MRSFIVLCLVAVACADKLGYNYQPVPHTDIDLTSGVGVGIVAPAVTYDPTPIVEYEKEFFSFAAPESEFVDHDAAQRVAEGVKKGLRVIFIKGPENQGLENAALALAKQAAQQETAIYVLNKQTDIGELATKLNSINTGNNLKPEVHFVKYRTQEDAVNAQRVIQSQYDSLAGNSHSINGGVAPVLNFASAHSTVGTAAPQVPKNAYLPTSVFRR
ncbi:uncharacterized protein LOC133330224 [Musca vetustissima]|uniref:uncharacterized protein LOC133330224 n=1 Tax=Musca vetustissima TaxID=27455 RepID=UPI002AB72B54|nr:uncharacterized protein LOC133330224 [Musca vetustissima]